MIVRGYDFTYQQFLLQMMQITDEFLTYTPNAVFGVFLY